MVNLVNGIWFYYTAYWIGSDSHWILWSLHAIPYRPYQPRLTIRFTVGHIRWALVSPSERAHVLKVFAALKTFFLAVAADLWLLGFICGVSYNLWTDLAPHSRYLILANLRCNSTCSRAAIASALIFVMVSWSARVNSLSFGRRNFHSFMVFKFCSVNSTVKFFKSLIHLLFSCRFDGRHIIPVICLTN